MSKNKLTQLFSLLSLTLLFGVGFAFGHPAALTDTVRRASDLPDSIVVGSISGRVFNDAGQSEETETAISEGVAGVRVILREAGNNAIVSNRISDGAGRFDFEALRPGKYTVEVDSVSMPAKYRLQVSTLTVIDVEPAHRSNVELPIAARRQIAGFVFIDNDGDGRYQPGKDEPAQGAFISVAGQLAVSGADGSYILRDLPAGRIGMLVSWPKKNENTHVVLYLPPGPVTNRVVNVSKNR